ncbi:MAG: hypothetical protein IPH41_16105 [Sulfuritalea sp.]|jgi:hypothetical protein|nr:hypothetical protein [Sulfuritalea sp.]
MATHTADHGFSFHLPRLPHLPRRPASRTRITAASAPRASWMERLAAWAERQPAHHHAGSWERFR